MVQPSVLAAPTHKRRSHRHRRPKDHHGTAYAAVAFASFVASSVGALAVVVVDEPQVVDDMERAETFAVPRVDTLGDIAEARAERMRVVLQRRVRLEQFVAWRVHVKEVARVKRVRVAKLLAVRVARERSRTTWLAVGTDWVRPVASYRLTANFGDVGLWGAGFHTGQDFAAPEGTSIRAVGDGEIISADYDGGYGNKLVLGHRDGTQTWYCHLSAFVRTDGSVQVGEIIGRVGTTGNTTGPHLHFEVRPTPDVPIEPLTWLRAHGVGV